MTRRDPIVIVPYDPSWPARFEEQRQRVAAALQPWLAGAVEHIGSTAVPGLPAKPIIDMAARIHPADGPLLAAAMAGIGWAHAPEPGDVRKWSFCFPDVAYRSHHLHVYEAGDPRWQSLLTFRDHLRRHPAAAAEYARIKQSLAADDNRDRPRYRAGKAPFIEAMLTQLR